MKRTASSGGRQGLVAEESLPLRWVKLLAGSRVHPTVKRQP